MRYHVIGAGGVGYQLVPHLQRLRGGRDVVDVWDGDRIELGNLGRQWGPKWLGMNKAEAMVEVLGKGCRVHPVYVEKGTEYEWGPETVFIVLPDRLEVRLWVWKMFKRGVREGRAGVFVTGGNDKGTGWAVGVCGGCRGKLWEWPKAYRVAPERTREERIQCATLEQGWVGNTLTALGIGMALETILLDGIAEENQVEVTWSKEEREGGIRWTMERPNEVFPG